MKLNRLGRTEINVSEICLGTMTWGEQNTIQEAHEQLDYALDKGVNFIDTAEMYPVPANSETAHRTEEYIGKWDKLKTQRDQIILATKVIGHAEWLPHIRSGGGLDKKNIKAALEESLKRLQTDYIDLYQLHWPDRKTNFFGQRGYTHHDEESTPILESLEAMGELIKEGKIRHFGLSNETAWGAMKYLSLSEAHHLPRPVSIQNPYSLLNRTYEVGLAEVSHREQIGLLAYSPLAFGVLSGKYLKQDEDLSKARLTLFPVFNRYMSELGVKATKMYVELALDHGLSPTQMALQYVTKRSFMTSNIIGATTLTQLKENIGSADIQLSDSVLEEIEKIQEMVPNPCP